MFFENDGFSVRIFAVERFVWDAAVRSVRPRPFGALVFRIGGEGRFFFGDGTRVLSRAGDVIYVPQGLSYEVEHTAGEVLAMHFRESGGGERAENYTPKNSCAVAELFFEAHRLFSAGTLPARMETLSVFYKLLSMLGEGETQEACESTAFLRAFSILAEEYADAGLGIAEICSRAGISESAFRRSFCARYGKPPIRFLTELRLRRAQRLLVSGKESVESIALSCGFRDVKYFYRVFKRYFGTTPSESRSV